MKRILLSLMMLCGATSLCHAQKIIFEYDKAGNLVKRRADIHYEKASFSRYYNLIVGPSPTKGPLTIKVTGSSDPQSTALNYKMQVMVHPISGSGTGYSGSFDKCEAKIDISNPYQYPAGTYNVAVLVFDNPQGAPSQSSVKIIKK